jgi:ABC-type branched-subunit amino acid transport system permease subunit
LREDELAAELLTMPTARLKLLGFAFGAGVAGLAGLIFASQQTSVFPTDFAIPILITLYAMLVLGGAGSLFGVAVGAVLINVTLEVLRTPQNASWLFAGVAVVGLAMLLRPWWRFVSVVAGTVVFGLVVHELAERWRPSLVAGQSVGDTWIDERLSDWVLLPANIVTEGGVPSGAAGRLMYLTLIAAILGLTLIRNVNLRAVAIVPVLYLTATVWENLLLPQASVTRFILIGAMLVTLMAVRPQGLFGKPRVEIV